MPAYRGDSKRDCSVALTQEIDTKLAFNASILGRAIVDASHHVKSFVLKQNTDRIRRVDTIAIVGQSPGSSINFKSRDRIRILSRSDQPSGRWIEIEVTWSRTANVL